MSSQTVGTSNRWRWLAFATVLAAAVMDLLDSTIAQVAAPSIRRGLGGSFADLEWVTAAYTLAMGTTLLTGGRLGDIFGRRRILLAGIAAFVVGSLACAVAASPFELIVARAAQGAAGGIMLPQVMGLMRDLFAPEEMGKAFGVYAPVMGLSAMLGPLLAGGLISADLFGTGWRMLFLVNVPVGALALYAGAKLLPGAAPVARGARLDLTGMVVAAVGMCLLVYPLVQGHQLGWPEWLWAMLGTGVPVLGAFSLRQVRRARSGRATLVDPGIFIRRGYAAGLGFSLVFIGSMGGLVLLFNVLLQAGLGFSPWHSAITTAPWAAGAFVGSATGAMSVQRLGRRVLHAGLIVEAAGVLALTVVLHSAGAGVTTLELLAPMIVGGAGMGMVFVPLFDIAIAGVEPHEIGSASAVLQSVNGLAMSLGIAGLGAIFFGMVNPRVDQAHSFLGAAEWTALITVALLACAFVIAYRLPRHARQAAGAVTALEEVAA
jgi:EmrB/QacA subfamily drug resistance transporter